MYNAYLIKVPSLVWQTNLTNYGLTHLTIRSLGNLTNRKLQGVILQKLACQTGPYSFRIERLSYWALSLLARIPDINRKIFVTCVHIPVTVDSSGTGSAASCMFVLIYICFISFDLSSAIVPEWDDRVCYHSPGLVRFAESLYLGFQVVTWATE